MYRIDVSGTPPHVPLTRISRSRPRGSYGPSARDGRTASTASPASTESTSNDSGRSAQIRIRDHSRPGFETSERGIPPRPRRAGSSNACSPTTTPRSARRWSTKPTFRPATPSWRGGGRTSGRSVGRRIPRSCGHGRLCCYLGDREDVAGRGEPFDALRKGSVEPPPPRPLARYGESVGTPGEGTVLCDQQGESRPPDVTGEPLQKRRPASVLLACLRAGGLHVQIGEVLPQGLGLPAVQPAQAYRAGGSRCAPLTPWLLTAERGRHRAPPAAAGTRGDGGRTAWSSWSRKPEPVISITRARAGGG